MEDSFVASEDDSEDDEFVSAEEGSEDFEESEPEDDFVGESSRSDWHLGVTGTEVTMQVENRPRDPLAQG